MNNKLKYGWAWNKQVTAREKNQSLVIAVKMMTTTLEDKRPLLTFNTDWNTDECASCGETYKYHELGGCSQI